MKTPNSRVLIIASAIALLLVGVAAVAFALGARSVGPSPTQAARPSGMPGNSRAGQVATATVTGTVARKSNTAIVVTTAAGKKVTINVSPTTRFVVRGVATPTLASVSVGNRIAAQGTLNKDGSLDAKQVQVIANGMPGMGAGRNPGGVNPGGRSPGIVNPGARTPGSPPSPKPSASSSAS
jgi:hypothetical protein